MKRKDYPHWFNANHKPQLYVRVPKKEFNVSETIGEIYTGSGYGTFMIGDREFLIDCETSYQDCYYEDDRPEVVCKITEIATKVQKNPNYETELKKLNLEKKKHAAQIKEWEELKKKWDEEVEKERVKREKKQLAALKKKYESK